MDVLNGRMFSGLKVCFLQTTSFASYMAHAAGLRSYNGTHPLQLKTAAHVFK
jgi:hypothetical protein